MPQASYNLDLPKKPIRADRCTQLRMKDLDRNGTPVTNIVREVDRRHAATPDFTLDDISACKCFVQE
jgi:hypothetical protein